MIYVFSAIRIICNGLGMIKDCKPNSTLQNIISCNLRIPCPPHRTMLSPPWAVVLPVRQCSLKTENIWIVWKLGRPALPLLVMLMLKLPMLLPMLFWLWSPYSFSDVNQGCTIFPPWILTCVTFTASKDSWKKSKKQIVTDFPLSFSWMLVLQIRSKGKWETGN